MQCTWSLTLLFSCSSFCVATCFGFCPNGPYSVYISFLPAGPLSALGLIYILHTVIHVVHTLYVYSSIPVLARRVHTGQFSYIYLVVF